MSVKKVFISYSRVNRDFVAKLVTDLKAAGLEVWFDKQIRTGTEWDEVLEQEILEADNLIIVLSKTSVKSDNVKNEMFFAQQNNTVVNLIKIEECPLPLAMARMHYIDFTLGYEAGVKRLAEDINYIDEGAQPKTEKPVETTATTRQQTKKVAPPVKKKSSGILKYLIGAFAAVLVIVVAVVMCVPKDENLQITDDSITTTIGESGWRKVSNSTSIEDYFDYIETYGDDEKHFDDALQGVQDLLLGEGAVIMDRNSDEAYFYKYLYLNPDGLYMLNNPDDPDLNWPETGDILIAQKTIVVLDPDTGDVLGGVMLQPGDYVEYFGIVDEDADQLLVKFYYKQD